MREALAPLEDALRTRFPSREVLLAEARAQTHRRRAAGRKLGTGAVAMLVAALWWVDPAWRTEDIHTAVGEQAEWTMRDGSRVTLNTDTALRVESRLRSRRFVLVQGEASFEVAHGWRPFVVRAGTTQVRDIGTVFTLRRLPDGAEVKVLQGAVEVSATDRDGRRTLVTGEALVTHDRTTDADTDAARPALEQLEIRHIDVRQAGAWQHGRLMFDGQPLGSVVQELQRYRVARIAIDDARVAQYRLSGAYDIKGIEALIDTLPHILPVRIVRGKDGSVRIEAG